MMVFIRTVLTEFNREWRSFFVSVTGYLFFIIFLVLVNILTFSHGRFFERGEASLGSAFFVWHSMLYSLFIPALGMRMWAEENRQGTSELLFSHPAPLSGIILGKYLAVVFVAVLALACTFPLVISVHTMGDVDFGPVISGYLGSILVISAFAAITCMFSAMFRSQVVAFITSAIVCYGLILISSQRITNEIINIFPESRDIVDLFASFGVAQYHGSFLIGLIDLRSVLYFVIISALALTMNGFIVKRRQITA